MSLFTVESHSLFVAVAEREVNIVIIIMLVDKWDVYIFILLSLKFVVLGYVARHLTVNLKDI